MDRLERLDRLRCLNLEKKKKVSECMENMWVTSGKEKVAREWLITLIAQEPVSPKSNYYVSGLNSNKMKYFHLMCHLNYGTFCQIVLWSSKIWPQKGIKQVHGHGPSGIKQLWNVMLWIKPLAHVRIWKRTYRRKTLYLLFPTHSLASA